MEGRPTPDSSQKPPVSVDLPYTLKPNWTNWIGMVVLAAVCLGIITVFLLLQQWQVLVVFGPLLVGLILIIVAQSSRRIKLEEDSFLISGTFQRALLVKYENIEQLEIVAGGKVYLKVISKQPRPSMRIGLTPFSNSEWSKFIQIVSQQSPGIVLNSTAQRWKRGSFY